MLVLSRKPGEKIQIGSGITLTVIEVRNNKVRLGIEAPLDVPVMREELLVSLEGTARECREAARLEMPASC